MLMAIEKENKYHHSKIYKITDTNYTKMYIGSTTQELSERMAGHRREYKYQNKHMTTSAKLFEEFGVENCKIELLEEVHCENRDQLRKVEGKYIQENMCVNRKVEGRTNKEYREANKDKYQQYHKQYNEKHKESIKEKRKIYRAKTKDKTKQYAEANKDKIHQYRLEYYRLNKEKLNQLKKEHYELQRDIRQLEKTTCECGQTVLRCNLNRHKKTELHNSIINKQIEI